MPTKIVLDVSEKRPSPIVSQRSRGKYKIDEEDGRRNRYSPSSVSQSTGSKITATAAVTPSGSTEIRKQTSPRASSAKRIVKFRSSIFRDHEEMEKEKEERNRGLSTTDIRASPRLVGYVYQLLASTVLLISVVKFYRTSQNEPILSIDPELLRASDKRIYQSAAGPIYYWKLVGSAIVGAVGAGLCAMIVVAHFDTVGFPRLWMAVFRDGSKIEQVLLRGMLLFWAVSLHVCTSSLSVGQVQGNVFFTTWIAFASACVNYGVWRDSAGFPSIAEKITLHHRETTYNWVWLLICILIFAGASVDVFFNREEVTFRHNGKKVDLSDQTWILIISIIWSFVGLSLICLLLNHHSTNTLDIHLCGTCRIWLGWRHIEGFVILFLIGIFFWLIYKHTGVNGVINGLNNSYFSLWGAFCNSVFLLGTWLRENKNLEYITGEESDKNVRRVTFQLSPPRSPPEDETPPKQRLFP